MGPGLTPLQSLRRCREHLVLAVDHRQVRIGQAFRQGAVVGVGEAGVGEAGFLAGVRQPLGQLGEARLVDKVVATVELKAEQRDLWRIGQDLQALVEDVGKVLDQGAGAIQRIGRRERRWQNFGEASECLF